MTSASVWDPICVQHLTALAPVARTPYVFSTSQYWVFVQVWIGFHLKLDYSAKLFSLTFLLVTFGAMQSNSARLPLPMSSFVRPKQHLARCLLRASKLA